MNARFSAAIEKAKMYTRMKLAIFILIQRFKITLKKLFRATSLDHRNQVRIQLSFIWVRSSM
jgi:hypothetical protein